MSHCDLSNDSITLIKFSHIGGPGGYHWRSKPSGWCLSRRCSCISLASPSFQLYVSWSPCLCLGRKDWTLKVLLCSPSKIYNWWYNNFSDSILAQLIISRDGFLAPKRPPIRLYLIHHRSASFWLSYPIFAQILADFFYPVLFIVIKGQIPDQPDILSESFCKRWLD